MREGLYVAELSNNSSHVALLAGITFSAAGLANIIAAPQLGRISDKIGPHKVMLGALIASGIFFIPQALAGESVAINRVSFYIRFSISRIDTFSKYSD